MSKPTTTKRTPAQEVESIVAYVHEALDKAWKGVERIDAGDVLQQSDGVKDAVVWGRTATFILQQLSSRVERWSEWWEPQVLRMRSDPLLKYFNRLRSVILKTGETQIGFKLLYQPGEQIVKEVLLSSPMPHKDAQLAVNAAIGFCWIYEQNGERKTVPVPSPTCVGATRHCFMDLEDAEFPSEYATLSLAEALSVYLERIEEIVEATFQRFVGANPGHT